MDQLAPFHTSTKALVCAYLAVEEEPTATQETDEGHATPCSVLLVVTAGTATLTHWGAGAVVVDVGAVFGAGRLFGLWLPDPTATMTTTTRIAAARIRPYRLLLERPRCDHRSGLLGAVACALAACASACGCA